MNYFKILKIFHLAANFFILEKSYHGTQSGQLQHPEGGDGGGGGLLNSQYFYLFAIFKVDYEF